MIEYIAHRVNTSSELYDVSSEYGVEIDLRDSCDGSLYMSHDPFVKGEDFEEYLRNYSADAKCSKGTMILNIKSERIEHKVIELLKKHEIRRYFFLDSTFPMIKLLSDMGEKNIAVRFSEYEGLDTVMAMRGKIDWVWVDCFTRFPLDIDTYAKLKNAGFKLCIVSPELQGQPEKIEEYAGYMKENSIIPDAVCTKIYNIDKWKYCLEPEEQL